MIALTFDTDWMQQADLYRFLETYDFPGEGTFFMHRPYPALSATGHECCLHPLPSDMPQDLQALKASLNRLLQEYELTATGIRTHSCLHSHVFEVALMQLGFRYTSQTSRLFMDSQPVRSAWGLWELPVYYMDNLDLAMAEHWPNLAHQPLALGILEKALESDMLHVFDFHPVHICLNTPNLDYYVQRRDDLKLGVSPFDIRFAGQGVGTFFAEFIKMLRARQQKSVSLISVMPAYNEGENTLEHHPPRAEISTKGRLVARTVVPHGHTSGRVGRSLTIPDEEAQTAGIPGHTRDA